MSLEVFLTPLLRSLMLASLVQFAVNVAVVFLAAYASYNLYEVHFLRLKRYFGYGGQRERIPAVVAEPVQ